MIGVAAVLGTTFTGQADDIRGINDLLVATKNDRGLDVPLCWNVKSGCGLSATTGSLRRCSGCHSRVLTTYAR
jgi:hypothetical protein